MSTRKTSSKPLLRVTDVLRPWTMQYLSGIPDETLQQGMRSGTDCHAICAAIARGEWVPSDKGNEAHVASYKKWLDAAVGVIVYVEHTMTDEALGITGTLDLFCILKDGRYCLVDIKRSSSILPTYFAQVAAYLHLLKHPLLIHPSKENVLCGILQLNATGKQAKLYEVSNINAWWSVFLSALNCAKAFGIKGGR